MVEIWLKDKPIEESVKKTTSEALFESCLLRLISSAADNTKYDR